MADSFLAGGFVVMSCFNGGGAEDVIEVVSVWLLFNPFTDCSEHVAVDFNGLIAKSRVMEDAEDVSHYFVHVDAWIFPSVDDAAVIC